MADPRARQAIQSMDGFEIYMLADACSRYPASRAEGILRLGDTGKKEFVPIAEMMLKDRGYFSGLNSEDSMFIGPKGHVCAFAIRALEALNAKRSTPLIRQKLNDPAADVRRAVIITLVSFGVRDSVQLLREKLNDRSKEVRTLAANLLSRLTEDKRFHRLYMGHVSDAELGNPGRSVVRRPFSKTGSKTTLLGGRLFGKVIIREIEKGPMEAWVKALTSVDAWRKAGFDYVPIEPIMSRKNGRLRIYRTREGTYRIYTKVLGRSLRAQASIAAQKEARLQRGQMEHEDLKSLLDWFEQQEVNPAGLGQEKKRILDVVKSLGIDHGHEHNENFCVEMHNGKPRLYLIDFDQAKLTS
ncbi:MAG: HEAT repeat domain-containing protein [Candidatus Diapherotrites archaeon]|nr:HEAT repeat domain-containing protein [Candidatus Diapherotrites archaeon]